MEDLADRPFRIATNDVTLAVDGDRRVFQSVEVLNDVMPFELPVTRGQLVLESFPQSEGEKRAEDMAPNRLMSFVRPNVQHERRPSNGDSRAFESISAERSDNHASR